MSSQTQTQTEIEVRTLIDAPVERVFAYYANPSNLPEIWPSLIEVTDVKTDGQGNYTSFRWVYKMAGLRFSGSSEVRECEPNRRYVTVSKGGLESTFVTEFEAREEMTEVYERVSYRIPIPLLGRVAERVLMKMNENELKLIHLNLMAKMAGGA